MEKRKHRFLGRITSVLLAFTVVFGMCGMVFPEEASAASSLKSPQNVIVKAGKTTAKISWDKADKAKGYEVYAKAPDGKYKKVKTLKKGSSVSFTHKELKKNKTYTYKVRSIAGKDKSSFSSVVSMRTTNSKLKNVKSLKLSDKTVELRTKGTETLKAELTPSKNLVSKKVKWTTSDKKVATVSSAGKITAVGEGSCNITATAHNGKKAVCKVTVKAPLSMTEDVEKYVEKVDKDFAWEVTNTLSYDEKYWDDSTGWRTAGSDAEHRAADYLADTFKKIGLEDVKKEPVTVDKWQFNGAEFTLENKDADVNVKINPVSYASSGTDSKGITGEVVYLGHGYEADYEKYYDEQGLKGDDRNMNGKIVLIDINQNADYWITPHYHEAYFQGAAGLMSYSSQYVDKDGNQRGDKWDTACQIQDLCSLDYKLPCVSISRADGLEIINGIEKIKKAGKTPTSKLVVDNEVGKQNGTSYNIVGKIKGTGNTGQQILVAGHYDKYFYGTNDDCAAIGLVAAMAKAMVDSEYKPLNDIIFIAHGAEEWGRQGTETDWAEGSWQMITKVHPEWQGTTLGILNYELPAKKGHNKGLKGTFRTTEENYEIQNEFLKESGLVGVLGATAEMAQKNGSQPMSDAICYQYKGVPCYEINAQYGTGGNDLSTYHTKYDDKDEYSSEAMDYALKFSGAVAMYIDNSPAVVFDYTLRCDELEAAIEGNEALYKEAGIDAEAYKANLNALREAGKAYTVKAKQINAAYEKAIAAGEATDVIIKEAVALNKQGLEAYRYLQDNFLGMSGDGNVYVFHKIVQDNINTIDTVVKALESGDTKTAFGNAWKINGGVEYGAYSFSNKVSEEALKTVFCEYLTDNRSYGKKVARADTYEATHALLTGANSDVFKNEIAIYEKARVKLVPELKTYMNQEIEGMSKLAKMLEIK